MQPSQHGANRLCRLLLARGSVGQGQGWAGRWAGRLAAVDASCLPASCRLRERAYDSRRCCAPKSLAGGHAGGGRRQHAGPEAGGRHPGAPAFPAVCLSPRLRPPSCHEPTAYAALHVSTWQPPRPSRPALARARLQPARPPCRRPPCTPPPPSPHPGSWSARATSLWTPPSPRPTSPSCCSTSRMAAPASSRACPPPSGLVGCRGAPARQCRLGVRERARARRAPGILFIHTCSTAHCDRSIVGPSGGGCGGGGQRSHGRAACNNRPSSP